MWQYNEMAKNIRENIMEEINIWPILMAKCNIKEERNEMNENE